MMYEAALWGGKEHRKLNMIQNRACKFFLGVAKTASNVASHGDMGWLAVFAKQKIEIVRLWCRLQTMDTSRITYKVFKWSNSLSLGNVKTWEYHVKQFLKDANMLDHPFMNPDINVKVTMREYRDALIASDKVNWHNKVWDDTKNEENGNKLRLYRCYKDDICVESYVTTIMPFHHRQKIAMLRLGCLPIQIELGRRSNTPLDSRICKLCNQGCIEDEVHLLLQCPLYDDIRSIITKHVTDTTMSFKDQFCSLLSNPDIQADLGKCVFRMMNRRQLFSM